MEQLDRQINRRLPPTPLLALLKGTQNGCYGYASCSSYACASATILALLMHVQIELLPCYWLNFGARARWLAAAPLAFYFCMCTLICCYASCSSFAWQGDLPSTLLALLVHGHTDLLLRHLSFLKELCENVPIIVPLSSAVGRNLPEELLKNLLETPRSGQFSKVHGQQFGEFSSIKTQDSILTCENHKTTTLRQRQGNLDPQGCP